MKHNPSGGESQRRKRRLLPRTPPDYDSRIDGRADPSETVHQDNSSSFPAIQPTDLPADIVLKRLRALGRRVLGSGPWQANCPAHPDSNPSLSLTETSDGVLLMHCWGGCDNDAVLAKLGLNASVYYPSLYALQFGKRHPQGSLRFHGGGYDDEIEEPTPEDCAEWAQLLKRMPLPRYALNQLAVHLDLPRESLLALHVGYNPHDQDGCWVFPERDDRGRIVGLVRRYHTGSKFAMRDSTRGLTIPDYGEQPPPGPVYLVEGASDTAALVSVGAFAIGRINAEGSALERLWLTRLLARHADRDVIVVGEQDAGGAGMCGAAKLALCLHTALQRPVTWALPRKPHKDSREQVVAGKWSKGLRTQEVLK